MKRQNILLGNPYEEIIGFSRAVRTGPFITVGGTAPIGDDGTTVGVEDVEAQARRCFEILSMALQAAGSGLEDVVRTRILLTRIEDCQIVARVRKEYVGEYRTGGHDHAGHPIRRAELAR